MYISDDDCDSNLKQIINRFIMGLTVYMYLRGLSDAVSA